MQIYVHVSTLSMVVIPDISYIELLSTLLPTKINDSPFPLSFIHHFCVLFGDFIHSFEDGIVAKGDIEMIQLCMSKPVIKYILSVMHAFVYELHYPSSKSLILKVWTLQNRSTAKLISLLIE